MSTLFKRPIRNRPQVTGAMMAEVKRIEEKYNEKVCAISFDRVTGEMDDCTFNWETAETFANEGRSCIVAIAGDGYKTKDEIQRLCDYTTDAYDDCFGRSDKKIFN